MPPGFVTGIELLNDDKTPMAFVVEMLEKHLQIGREEAVAVMLDIHTHGGRLLPLPDVAHSERVASAIAQQSLSKGYPLVCRAVDVNAR